MVLRTDLAVDRDPRKRADVWCLEGPPTRRCGVTRTPAPAAPSTTGEKEFAMPISPLARPRRLAIPGENRMTRHDRAS